MNHLMNTYARLPVAFVTGKGAQLFDAHGQAYLDSVSGIAVCNLGHAHPAIAEAICEQSHKLIHTSNLYSIDLQEALADKLIQHSHMDRVFFSNSGAEANEAALKIARKYGNDRGIENGKVIVMENSFHGRTLLTLSATGNEKVHAGFAPLVDSFIRVPFNDLEAIRAHSANPQVVAILVEPVQGEGGVFIPADDYLTQIRQICDANEWLMMIDEVQTGVGRTGKWFAHQHANIVPDVMSLAKALGNGFPIGACLAKGKAAEVFAPGNHGTTFGGNPLACATGLAVINTLEKSNLIEQAAINGAVIVQRFKEAFANIPGVKEVRGKGYMIGIQLDRPCGDLVKMALEKHLLINVTRGDTIRLLPPLIMNDEQTNELVEKLTQLVTNFYQ